MKGFLVSSKKDKTIIKKSLTEHVIKKMSHEEIISLLSDVAEKSKHQDINLMKHYSETILKSYGLPYTGGIYTIKNDGHELITKDQSFDKEKSIYTLSGLIKKLKPFATNTALMASELIDCIYFIQKHMSLNNADEVFRYTNQAVNKYWILYFKENFEKYTHDGMKSKKGRDTARRSKADEQKIKTFEETSAIKICLQKFFNKKGKLDSYSQMAYFFIEKAEYELPENLSNHSTLRKKIAIILKSWHPRDSVPIKI